MNHRTEGSAAEWPKHWMGRLSTRQRVVVLTFETAEQAEAWDANGCPLSALEATP